MKRVDYRLYAVTDRGDRSEADFLAAVEEALRGGVTVLQLREKNSLPHEKERLAKEVLHLCRQYRVPCLINDDVELAKGIEADGVHLGQSDMPPSQARNILGDGAIIGVTAKTVAQAEQAEAAGADYLGSGAMLVSATKTDALPLSRQKLIEIVRSTSLPVVAIGGLQADNLQILSGTGVAGAAISGGIFRAASIRQETETLKKRMTALLKEDNE
ncbi:MAG: thiamine phosphate synthase [Eubacteriales bacterium]|nr:thiamine phosphate synthase [Eubacteriales bacterium]